jgi:hypothetical protein|tara:strand:- start:249 stop:530 length:282 start_codon:yes stop_codon:yes gene_type:complete
LVNEVEHLSVSGESGNLQFVLVKRLLVLLSPLVFLFLAVPWYFVEPSSARLFGIPFWFIYAIAGSISFAILMAVLIGCYWEISARPEDNDDQY